MRCPYRTKVVHQPQKTKGYTTIFAEDITEFAECHEKECPYYDFYNRKCMKVAWEVEHT